MALPHASSGELIDVRPLGPALTDAVTHALFKSEQLEVAHVVLRAGETYTEHQVPGEITVQCIEGRVQFDANDTSQLLLPGHMFYLRAAVPHTLRALEDTALLLTICRVN